MDVEDAAIIYEEAAAGLYSIVLRHYDGTEERFPAVSPAEDLIALTEIDYGAYRREVDRLWEEHPLFKERPIVRVKEPDSDEGVSEADYADFMKRVCALPSMLREIDPLSYFAMSEILRATLHFEDDGSAMFLLEAGRQMLNFLREPILIQVYFRNIFEMTFDGTERMAQQERYKRLCDVYPEVGRACDPAKIPPAVDGKWVLASHHVFELRMLQLALYFQQDRQRIVRCEYCWRYFIPRTRRPTIYCDRVTDGASCKKKGAQLKRDLAMEQDKALLLCKQLRDRMFARFLRFTDAAPSERDRLISMDYQRYDTWSKNASAARADYVAGKLSSEEFLRRIDTTHELTSYEADKAELVEQTRWQRLVARDLNFDPEEYYPSEMAFLDLGEADPSWSIFTRDDLRRRDQQGHQSLREKFGKGPPLA